MNFFFLFLMLFVGLTANANISNPETLLDINNPDLTKTENTTVFSGKPAIMIETLQKNIPETNIAETLPPLILSNQVKDIPIKTLFGHDRTAPYVDHTTDFVVLLQILDNNTIHIEEQIQFINTKRDQSFKRTLLKKITDKNGKEILLNIKPTVFFQGNERIKLDIIEDEENITFQYPEKLSTGINRFTIQYIIKGAIYQDKSLAEITIPLIGLSWPLITERFSAVLMMPQKSPFYTNELLFGTNNQQLAENFTVQTDIKGNAVYQLTHPLPAFADVRLHTVFDANLLPKSERQIADTTLILLSYFGILCLYTIMSVLVCRFHKFKKVLIKAKKVNPLLWRIEIGKPFYKEQSERMAQINSTVLGLKYLRNNILGKILAFIRFNFEYIIGIFVLIICTKIITVYWGTQTPNIFWLIIGGFLSVLIIDFLGTRSEWQRFAKEIKYILLTTPQGLNLSQRDILPYYILAICLDFDEEWILKLTQNNPTYRELSFIKKEK